MKKHLLLIVLCALLICNLAVPAQGAAQSVEITDLAELMTGAEEAALEIAAAELSRQYNLHIVILTTNTLEGKSPQEYADDYYDLSCGEDSDGILFLLSMEDRDWYISTCGRAMELYTDREVYVFMDVILSYFSDGDYYDGFAAWLEDLPYYLDAEEPEPEPSIWICLGAGLLVAVIVILIMRSGMNTKRKQQSARHYLVPETYHLRTQQDFFLYSNVTKTARPKDNDSSSGGGRSHGGGGGKF